MESQTQDKIYIKLRNVWKTASTSKKIYRIPKKDSFFEDLGNLVNFMQKQINNCNDSTMKFVYLKTISNIKYMVNDILECRSEKILQFARDQERIDENSLLKNEIMFYRQVYTAFRGQKNSKKIINNIITNNSNAEIFTDNIDLNSDYPDLIDLDGEISVNNNNNKIKKEKQNIKTKNKIEKKSNNQEIISNLSNNQADKNIKINESDRFIKERALLSKSLSKSTNKLANIDMQYITIRIKTQIPAIVGDDFKIYGPFEKEQVVNLPKRNSDILIKENLATILIL